MESRAATPPPLQKEQPSPNEVETERKQRLKLFQRSKNSLRHIMRRSPSHLLASSTDLISNRTRDHNGSDESAFNSGDAVPAPRLVLRVSVVRAQQLQEDPANVNAFAVVRCAGQQQRTQVVKKSAEPEWECTFDVRLSGNRPRGTRRRLRLLLSRGLLISIWDKDRFKSVFLGQARLAADSLFPENELVSYESRKDKTVWLPVVRNRSSHFSKVRRRKPSNSDEIGQVEIKYGLTLENSSVPLSDDELRDLWTVLFEHRDDHLNGSSSSQPSSDKENSSSTPGPPRQHRRRRLVRRKKTKGDAGTKVKRRNREDDVAKFHPDIFGVMYIEIVQANDLPPEKNMTRTGFDMDPFVVISYGKTTFRTRSIRHNLNPVWNEKLMFHVRANETRYRIKFAIYDKDKLSKNDHVAWADIPISDFIDKKNKQLVDQALSSEAPSDAIEAEMELHTVDLELVNKDRWTGRRPTLTYRAKFVPYQIIRKMFWATLAKASGINVDGKICRLEVLSLLESLGSTISETTLDSFWKKYNKNPETETLSLEEFIDSIEEFMSLSDIDNHRMSAAVPQPALDEDDGDVDEERSLSSDLSTDEEDNEINAYDDIIDVDDFSPGATSSSGMSDEPDMDDVLLEAREFHPELQEVTVSAGTTITPSDEAGVTPDNSNEKVIRLSECPICHRPFVSKRAQMDIVTHVATCAANDWTAVDKFLMGDFVTEAYAQRRWFVKLVSKVGYGTYKPGSDNANIIVQDRLTGQLIEERMSVYIRLGMRIMYKGMKTGIQSKAAQRILTNMTFRQGRRYDSPQSVREIQPFIKFHNLNMAEVLEPIESYRSFNEFFYRKLKPGARPCECPDNPGVAVSPADCRMSAFATISDATHLWIKGMDFTVSKLLGDDPETARYFEGGSLAIFRLAPQDYHRFHSPVDGTIIATRKIAGQYYTVNPMAIRTTLDVYGENAREVVMMDTKPFGKVAIVLIGAMLVGSIVLIPKVGDHVARTDELGYFAFGGSTIVVLWPKDTLVFDSDLLENSEKTLETLVRVGNRIGERIQ
ncbi:phosphatidylserine decarboxylase-domain-containing protein [Dichotomocladium elegans]|nr:phosphatidylserine decarboxylase-domain-containing protein [Dichotomocladium elegans]